MSAKMSVEKTGRRVRDFFPRVEVLIMRWHRFKLRGRRFKGNVLGMIFMQNVVGAWNVLPEDVVE